MHEVRGLCPLPANVDGIVVDDIPGATLEQLFAFRRELASSDIALQRAVDGLPRPAAFASDFDRTVFRGVMRAPSARVCSVQRKPPRPGLPGEFFVQVFDPSAAGTAWWLAVAFVDGRLVLAGVAEGGVN